MEENIIRMVHEKICHLGIEKTYQQIIKNYWFEHVKEKTDQFINNCLRFIMCSPPARINKRNLYNIPKKPIPFDTIHIDHFGPLPATVKSVRKHLLIVIDGFTKFVKLYPVKSTSTKEVMASLEKYYQNYSRPNRIVSDRATCFRSFEFHEHTLKNNIEHIEISVRSAQANGQVERVNRVLKTMLSKITDPISHNDWTKMVCQVEYALNNSTHSTTKKTPSQLLFGVDQKGEIIDYFTEHLEKKQLGNISTDDRNLTQIRQEASNAIAISQEKNLKYFAKKNTQPEVFSEGDFVVIRYIDTTIGTNKKFIQKYRGPYVIHKVLPNDRYVVRDIEDCQITQLPYDGVIEACNIKRWVTQINQNTCSMLEGST